MEITIHKLISEIKTLDGRIEQALKGPFFGPVKGSARVPVLASTITTEAAFKESLSGNLKSAEDLIARQHDLREKLSVANATNKVKVGDVEMTVAGAIAYKDLLAKRSRLIESMRLNLSFHTNLVNNGNESVERAIQAQISGLGEKNKIDEATMKGARDFHEGANKLALVSGTPGTDPVKYLTDEYDKLVQSVADINVVLVESNATCKVVIPD